jgi:hypothetical protein
MDASDLKSMKEMEAELSRFKRMYADLALENRALKDLGTDPGTLLISQLTTFSINK